MQCAYRICTAWINLPRAITIHLHGRCWLCEHHLQRCGCISDISIRWCCTDICWEHIFCRIVDKRSESAIKSTKQLVQLLGRQTFKKGNGKKKIIHPATRVFQVQLLSLRYTQCPLIKYHLLYMGALRPSRFWFAYQSRAMQCQKDTIEFQCSSYLAVHPDQMVMRFLLLISHCFLHPACSLTTNRRRR